VSPALLFALSAATCPMGAPAPEGPGFTAVAKLPATEAMRLNSEGKQLYRLERWGEARERYQAALAADPDFLSAQLNVACSFSRQGRYAEAAEESAKLIRRAFVPWNREVLEAADLSILQSQPVYAKVQAARTESAASWGRAIRDGIFFVARTRPPVSTAGQGVLVLGLGQELFAWIPETGRYLQLTAEDGRVLAYAVAADGRRVAYLLAGKLVRSPGQAALLRGLSLRVLDLPTMALSKSATIDGDLQKVRLWFSAAPVLKVTDASSNTGWFALVDDRLKSAGSEPRSRGEFVELSASGVEPGKRRVTGASCGFTLATQKDPTGLLRIVVSRPRHKPFTLDARYGAGLAGLPFPDSASTPRRPSEQSTAKP
jgi:hypothetical protein